MEFQIIFLFLCSTSLFVLVLVRKFSPKISNILKEDPHKKQLKLIKKKLNLSSEHVKENFQKSLLFQFFEPKRLVKNELIEAPEKLTKQDKKTRKIK